MHPFSGYFVYSKTISTVRVMTNKTPALARRRLPLAPLWLLLLSATAQAGELGDLLRAALENPSVTAAQGQATAAEAQASAARDLYLGQAAASYGLHRYSDTRVIGQYSSPVRGDDLTVAGLSYVVPLDIFGQVAATVDKAGGDAAAARLGVRRQQLVKLHQTLGAYYGLYALERRRAALAAYRKATEALVARLESEVKLGRSAPVQAIYARSQSFRLQSDETQLTGDIAATQASLAEAADKPGFLPQASVVSVPPWQDVASDEALAVQLARARETTAQAAVREARANLLPRLSADVGYSYSRAAGDPGAGRRDDWGYGLTLTLPLGATAFRQADAARANSMAAADATRASLRETESAMASLRAQYDAAIAETAAMEKETAYRQQIVDIEREMHRLGNETLENLFRHEDDLLEARTRLAQAQARAAAAWSGQQMLAGTDPDKYIDSLEKVAATTNENRKAP
jgi:outer membrane protein TolC